LCGGVVRLRKDWRHAGILIAHAGILVLLLGAFVSFKFSQRGHMTLYEGDSATEFVSYDAWEIAVAPVRESGSVTEHLIPVEEVAHVGPSSSVTFYSDDLPFDLTFVGYAQNARPVPVESGHGAPGNVVDGFSLQALKPSREAERNIPGVYVTVREKASGAVYEGILWGLAGFPWTVQLGGQNWTLDLRRCTWHLPFTVQLDRFTREVHPGTSIPKAFISDVTKIDGGIRQQARISMNAPLRSKGYIFYQASWGPPNAGPADRLYSSLAVVRNPADQLPLYASCVICFGLLVHFVQKLAAHLRAESSRRP